MSPGPSRLTHLEVCAPAPFRNRYFRFYDSEGYMPARTRMLVALVEPEVAVYSTKVRARLDGIFK